MNIRSVLVASVLCCIAPLTAQALQTKSGVLMVGEVSDANGDGLTFKRLDNGGTLQLHWDDLSPESVTRIKQMFSLSVEEDAEVTIDAEVFVYELPGGALAEAVGRFVESDGKTMVVRTKSMARFGSR